MDKQSETSNPSEWVYSFAGWLTSLDVDLEVGAVHNAAPMADLARQFCKEKGIGEPSLGWDGVPQRAGPVTREEVEAAGIEVVP